MKHHCQTGQHFPSPRTGTQETSTIDETESIFLRQLRRSFPKQNWNTDNRVCVWESIKLRRTRKQKFLEYDSACCQALTVGAHHVSRQSSEYRHRRWTQTFRRKVLLLSSRWRTYSLQPTNTIGAFRPPYYFSVLTYPQPHFKLQLDLILNPELTL